MNISVRFMKCLNERSGKHKENIIIRGIINDRLKEIAIWKPKYGIKMKL